MAITLNGDSRTVGPAVAAGRRSVGNYMRRAWRNLTRWHEHRVAEAHLRALDDVTLRDIGIHRSEIRSVVYGLHQDRTHDS